jgi:ABC-2 type transport system ATP-binding protein
MTPTIEAQGLKKRYGKTQALNGLDLVAERGQVVAVLGPNGAGKTTFVRAVATLLALDEGVLRVAGHDVNQDPGAVRRVIGLAGQFAAIEPAMSGRENLQMVARLFGHDGRAARRNADAVLEQLGLLEAADRLARTYSGGMRRRLDLGASLVGAPRLLLLDEPTTGLDPRSRMELWEAIRRLVDNGTDVLLTTQYLDEADHLADQVVIVDHGRVVASGTPYELTSGGAAEQQLRFRARPGLDTRLLVDALPENLQVDEIGPGSYLVAGRIDPQVVSTVTSWCAQQGVLAEELRVARRSLEDVFLELTGRELRS